MKRLGLLVVLGILLIIPLFVSAYCEAVLPREGNKALFDSFDAPNICFESCVDGKIHTYEIKKIYLQDHQVDINDNTINEFYAKLVYMDKTSSKMSDIYSGIELIIDDTAKTIEVTKVSACQPASIPECIVLDEGEGAIFGESERICFKSCVDKEIRIYEVKNIYWLDNQLDINDNTKNQFYSRINFADKVPSKMSDIDINIILTIDKNTKIVRLNSVVKCAGEVISEQTPIVSQEITPLISTEKCQGCLFNDKCVPYGTRAEGSYCALSGNIVPQKQADEFCENSYECDSNLCISTKCVSSSLWDKIIQWFSKIFRFR